MNVGRIRKLISSISKNLECNLHDGNPCATCSFGIVRDIEKLNDEEIE